MKQPTHSANKFITNVVLVLVVTFSLVGAFFFPSRSLAAPYVATPEEAIGQIATPPGTAAYMKNTGTANQLLPFISTLLTIGAVMAGIWVLINILMAGYSAIMSNGDPGAMDKVKTAITNSVIGLLLIILAYTFAALAGTIFFGDAKLFIQPTF